MKKNVKQYLLLDSFESFRWVKKLSIVITICGEIGFQYLDFVDIHRYIGHQWKMLVVSFTFIWTGKYTYMYMQQTICLAYSYEMNNNVFLIQIYCLYS